MSITLSLSDDFDVFDNLADVSFYSRTSGDTFGTAITCSALKRAVDGRFDNLKDARVANATVVFHLKASDLGGTRPKATDKLTDAESDRWLVVAAEYQTLQSRWRLYCNSRK